MQNTILSEKVNGLYANSTDSIRQNVFLDSKSFITDKYQYHDEKMKHLYHILQTENPKSIEELLDQCIRLKESYKEKYLDLISQTAVTLLKKEMFNDYDLMTQYELNAHKTMYITMDCIDLILNTYKSDHDEVCQELNKNSVEDQLKSVNSSGC